MPQALANGIIQGLLFAVVGLAFSLVYSTTRVFHIALGGIYTLAPYLLLSVFQLNVPWPVGLLAALILSATLGLACEEIIHWPFERKRAPAEIHLIGSLGAFLVVVQMTVLMWGNNTQVLRAGIDVVYNFAGFHVTQGQIVEAVAASLTLLAVFSWLWHTEIGLQFRALASNPPLLAVMGRDVRRIRRLVFALSGVLAALASVTTALDVGFDPNVGMRAILVGVAATIVGGRTSFVGAAVAGVFFGILRAQVVWHASARWEDAATFAVLATFLFLLPGGLHSLTVGKTRLEEQR